MPEIYSVDLASLDERVAAREVATLGHLPHQGAYEEGTLDHALWAEEPEPNLTTNFEPQGWENVDLKGIAKRWVAYYGGEGDRFTIEQEVMLSELIQSGLAEEAKEGDPDVIARGKQAQQALVEVNLRFALYFARGSVGKKHPGARRNFIRAQQAIIREQAEQEGLTHIPRGRQPKRAAGTYKPLGSYRSPRASLPDRSTAAIIGLIRAARSYCPKSVEGRPPKFSTYAAYGIQHTLGRLINHDEYPAVRFPDNVRAEINSYFGDYPIVSPDHKPPERIAQLLAAQETMSLDASYEDVVLRYSSDLDDPWAEDDHPEGFADIIDDPSAWEEVEANAIVALANDRLTAALGTLSERADTIIRLRFGLGLNGDSVGPMTLDEIAEFLTKQGRPIKRERVRQIEAKALSELRGLIIVRNFGLRDIAGQLYDIGADQPPQSWRGDDLVIPTNGATHYPDADYRQDFSGAIPVIDEAAFARNQEVARWAAMESWQVSPDEKWEAPVRSAPRCLTQAELIGISSLLDAAKPYHFSRSLGDAAGTPFPATLVDRVANMVGINTLHPDQISQLWVRFIGNTYLRLLESDPEQFSPDRVGQLFSKIMSLYLNDNDNEVRLPLPDYAQGKVGFLASGLSIGRVVINGDPGTNVAAWNGGYSEVIVNGNAGPWAGASMTGYASLEVRGHAGDNVGFGAGRDTRITCMSAGRVGLACAGAVIIGE